MTANRCLELSSAGPGDPPFASQRTYTWLRLQPWPAGGAYEYPPRQHIGSDPVVQLTGGFAAITAQLSMPSGMDPAHAGTVPLDSAEPLVLLGALLKQEAGDGHLHLSVLVPLGMGLDE